MPDVFYPQARQIYPPHHKCYVTTTTHDLSKDPAVTDCPVIPSPPHLALIMSVSEDHLSDILPSDKDGKHYSITQSIALENELNGVLDAENHNSFAPPDSLDPEVLTSMLVDLRITLASERKHFTSAMYEATSKNAALEARAADLEESLESQRAQTHAAEDRLVEAERKVVEGEQSLTMLRATLEESRRGIMRLQAESKRVSMSGASNPLPASTRASKRMSLNPSIPLPPNSNPRSISGHRRIASLSSPDSAAGFFPRAPSPELLSPSPSAPPLPLPSPVATSTENSSSPSPPADTEIATLRAELASTKRALAQATEARQASEDCLRALREFMASNASPGTLEGSQDLQGLRLPPLPSDAAVDEVEAPKPEPKKSGWGIKLWKETKETPSAVTASPPALERALSSTPSNESAPSPEPSVHRGSFSSWTRSASASVTSSSSPSIQPTLTPGNSYDFPREAMPVTSISSFRSKLGFFSLVANPISSGGSGAVDTLSITSSKASYATSTSDNSDGPHTDDEVAQVMPSDSPAECVQKDGNSISGDLTSPVSLVDGGFAI